MIDFLTGFFENMAGDIFSGMIGAAVMWLIGFLRQRSQAQAQKGRLTSSPDHSKVASEAGGEIYVIDGKGVRNLTNHPALDETVIWHPESKLIAFVSARDGSFQVWVMDSNTGKKVRLTEMDGKPRPIRWDIASSGAAGCDLIVRLGGSFLTIPHEEIQKRLA